MSSRGSPPDFDELAARYDELRPADANWIELFDVLIADGDLLGRRVLDIGCGTGALAAELARRGARVWGIDSSEHMLREARSKAGRLATFKRASAEALPFKDGWFERAVCRQVVHLVDRARAFPELARVLGPDGRVVIATFRPEHFERFWLTPYFPSIPGIDTARFPPPDLLATELRAADFADVTRRPLTQPCRTNREEALARIRGRFISTLSLLPDDEYAAGVALAEQELPAEIEYSLHWEILVATK